MKPTMLKKGTHVCSGRNCWAKAREIGDTIQLTFMTGMKPALTVARTWWKVRAPAITAMDTRYIEFWMGEICMCERASKQRRHGGQAYNQVADEDLHDLGLEALAAAEDLLQDADQDVAKRGADEGAVEGHLGDARGEVVALLAPIVGDPRGQELLQTRKGARGEHLGAQRVLLQVLQVGLWTAVSSIARSMASAAQGHSR